MGEVVLHFARIADEIVLVVTPEPTSLMDAYATVKILALRFGCREFRLVVNQVDPKNLEQTGLTVANHLQRVVARFLSVEGSAPVRLHHAVSLPSRSGGRQGDQPATPAAGDGAIVSSRIDDRTAG